MNGSNLSLPPWFASEQPQPLILASASPRRAELLHQVGIRFLQEPVEVDETWPKDLLPDDAVRSLARRKASVAATRHPGAVILAADTAVFLDSQPLGKPADATEAYEMLRRLSGRKHEVITGITIVDTISHLEISDSVLTEVWMREANDYEIAVYAKSSEPLDKAGAYGIQGMAAGFVTKICGCYSNVVGLPVSRVVAMLQLIVARRKE